MSLSDDDLTMAYKEACRDLAHPGDASPVGRSWITAKALLAVAAEVAAVGKTLREIRDTLSAIRWGD